MAAGSPSIVRVLLGLSPPTAFLGSDAWSPLPLQPPLPAPFPVDSAAAQPDVLPEPSRQRAAALRVLATSTPHDPGGSAAPAGRLAQPAARAGCVRHRGASPADGGDTNRGEPGASPGTAGLL